MNEGKVERDYILSEMDQQKEELIATLIRKRTAYNEAHALGNKEAEEKLYTEYLNMMKEIHLSHPEFKLSKIDQDVMDEAEEENWRLHGKAEDPDTSDPEKYLTNQAFEETKRHLTQSEEEAQLQRRINDLSKEYNSMMEEHVRAVELGDEVLAEKFLKKANKIINQINEIQPRIKGQTLKPVLDSDLDREARELTEKHLNKLN